MIDDASVVCVDLSSRKEVSSSFGILLVAVSFLYRYARAYAWGRPHVVRDAADAHVTRPVVTGEWTAYPASASLLR